MASPKITEISASELELKRRGRRRLIGAITLGLLIVVFLPMLFDAEPKRDKVVQQEISIQVPPKNGLPTLPAPLPPAPVGAPTVATKPGRSPANVEAVEPRLEIAKSAVESLMPPVTAAVAPARSAPAVSSKAETRTTRPADAKQGFVVQIGAFKDADNAQQTAARMKEAKLPVYTDNIATKTGNVTRVRVGPFNRKEQADAALAQVKLAGADGKIVPLP